MGRTGGRVQMARCCAAAALTLTAATGCFPSQTDHARKPGPAAADVTVVRGDETYPLTVRITQWQVGVHPQVPDRGAAVHYAYRAALSGPYLPEPRVELAVCAVDAKDIVLLCDTLVVYDGVGDTWPQDGDGWIGPDPGLRLSDTARVVLLPDQLLGDGNEGDPKDFDGYYPPDFPTPGDRLRVG